MPADQPTIQAGIDAAANGDVVLVAPGTYHENIDFKGKAISVASSAGAGSTIIDGDNHDGLAVVTFKSHELRNSVLYGFTIQHGGTQTASSQASGGVYISASAPSVYNNYITANHCSGIFANGGALLQANTVIGTIYQNPGTDSNCQQGGTGVVVEGTTAVGSYSYTQLLGNTIVANTQGVSAGGVAIVGAEGTFLQNNIIAGNNGSYVGAIDTEQVNSVVISNNLVYGNSAGQSNGPGRAGGLQLTAALATVSGNTFAANSLYSGTPSESATEVNLSTQVSHVNLVNNLIIGYSSTFPAFNCSAANGGGTPAFHHNDIYNANGKAYTGSCSDQTGISGNISADPLFAAAGTVFHLTAGSPAVDSGDNSAYVMPPIDLEGNPRIQDATHKGSPVVDMGVYEFAGALDGAPYNVVLISSLNPAAYGQQVTFTAYVTPSSPGASNPTGTITFTDGSTVLSTQTVQIASPLVAVASFPTSALAAGTHTITATFNPAAGSQGASGSLTETVTGSTSSTSVVSSLNPSPSGQAVTFTATVNSNSGSGGTPSGTVRFLDGSAVLATQTLTASGATSATASYTTSSLAAGTHTITASYDGNPGLSASSSTLPQTVTGASSTTAALTGTPNPASLGQNVSFKVTITSGLAGAGPPTGSVTLTLAGKTVLGTQTLTASGTSSSQATFTTNSLPLGGQSIQASYNPTGNFLGSTAAITETIVAAAAADFSLTLAQPAITLQTQHHTTTSLTLTSLNNFADTLALSCANLPAYVTCRFTPASASLTAGGTSAVSLYIDTDSVIGYAQLTRPDSPSAPRRFPAPATGLAIAAPVLLAASRRRSKLRTFSARGFLLLLASFAIVAGLAGCGSIILPYNIPPSATPGTYSIPITATGTTTGVTHTATLTLTVTP